VISLELVCQGCGWRTVCGRQDAIARLRFIGLLRRDPDPGDKFLEALFVESAGRLTCPVCKKKRLRAAPADGDGVDAADGWQAAVLCEVCRVPLPPERLEVLPGVKRCVACQGLEEAGATPTDAPEFCPRCGALIELRASRGAGITRYREFCTGDPPCRL